MALREVRVKNGKLQLVFDLKNKGKFRLKELSSSELQSTYSRLVKKQELDSASFYLEWQIGYYIETDRIPDVDQICVDERVTLTKGEVRPYELSGLIKLACEYGLIKEEELKQIKKWVCSSNKTLEKYLKAEFLHETDFELEGMKFKSGFVQLPFCIHENLDGTWIEVIPQKQQYAYGFQLMVYLCIPHYLFEREEDTNLWVWELKDVSSLVSLVKVFALTSEVHRQDVCKILEVLLKFCTN